MATRRIEHVAAKRELLTLDDVAAWVQDAMRSGATGTEVVGATVSFGGKPQKISVEVDAMADRDRKAEPLA